MVVAAQDDGPGIGRFRMCQIGNASAESLMAFVQDSTAPGSVVHTDGWLGYLPLESKGYEHEVTFLKGKKKIPSELMPRVHRVISLLKRWLMGTHQGEIVISTWMTIWMSSRSGSIVGDPRAAASSSFGSRSKLWPFILFLTTGSFTPVRERQEPNHNL